MNTQSRLSRAELDRFSRIDVGRTGWRLYAMYWLLPSLTVLKAILRIRAIADHFGLEREHQPTRTIVAPF